MKAVDDEPLDRDEMPDGTYVSRDRVAVYVSGDFDAEPILQYGLVQWWVDRGHPKLFIFHLNRRGPERRLRELLSGERIFFVTPRPGRTGKQIRSDGKTWLGFNHGLIVFTKGKPDRLARRLIRSYRWNWKRPVVIYRIDH